MRITSPAFKEGQPIPPKYTCDGEDLIAPLVFEDIPASATALALVMDDPDAPGGTWDHWVVWNIPSDQRSIDEGKVPPGVVGRNSWGKKAWGGPCPPDRQHRYVFTLYALESPVDLPDGAGKRELEGAIKNQIVAKAQLTAVYDRKSRRS